MREPKLRGGGGLRSRTAATPLSTLSARSRWASRIRAVNTTSTWIGRHKSAQKCARDAGLCRAPEDLGALRVVQTRGDRRDRARDVGAEAREQPDRLEPLARRARARLDRAPVAQQVGSVDDKDLTSDDITSRASAMASPSWTPRISVRSSRRRGPSSAPPSACSPTTSLKSSGRASFVVLVDEEIGVRQQCPRGSRRYD